MRELPTYREELAAINEAFPGKHLLTVTDVARFLGRTRDWTREQLGVSGCITTVALAHKLAEINSKNMKERITA